MPDHFHANFCEQMTNTYPQIPEISADNIKILLIEDDETDARLVKIYAGAIPNAQIIVDWVKSTSEAREKLQSGQYDLCIFDFWLRTHTSMSLLKDIRAANETLPVIILSHMTNEHMLEQSIGSGAIYVLGKNELNVTSLATAIDAMLFEDGAARVRLPNVARQKAQFDPAARDIAVKLVKVMDEMHGVYAATRPDLLTGAPSPDALEALRHEVSMLRLEWQANLRSDFDAASQIRSDYHDIGDLLAHAISAMTPVLARNDQRWQFATPATTVHAKCDAIVVVLMFMEQIYAVCSAAPLDSTLKFKLQQISGRISVCVGAATAPPPGWLKQSLPEFFAAHIGPRGFAYCSSVDDRDHIKVELKFPHLLN